MGDRDGTHRERLSGGLPCRRAEARLSPWLDGELDAGAARALEEHLEVCSPCRRRGEALAAAREHFRRLSPERSRLQAADVLARVAAEEGAGRWLSGGVREDRRWLLPRRWLPRVAALAVVTLVTVGIWQRVSREPPESAPGLPEGGKARAVPGAPPPLAERSPAGLPLAALEDPALDCGPEGADQEACRRFACLDAADCGADAEERWPPIPL